MTSIDRRATALAQTAKRREIAYRQMLLDVLRLARPVSCVHSDGVRGQAASCCDWAELVARIEAAVAEGIDYQPTGSRRT